MRSGMVAVTCLVTLLAGPVALAQGYIPDDPAKIAALPHITRYRAFLPANKDLSADLPPPGDQGKQGSCVAWSLGYGVRSYYDHKRNQTPFSGPQSVFSPAYIYNQLTNTPGSCEDGLNMLDALKLMRDKGIATVAEFPYQLKSCSAKPSAAVMQSARAHAISDFQAVELRPDDLKGQIAQGNPVAVGLSVDIRALSYLKAGQIYSVNSSASHDGHAVAFVGYDDRRQAFKFLNSWGRDWADQGFGWISYTAFQQDAHVAAVISDGAALPPPAPAPPPSPTIADWKSDLETLAKSFSCARLSLAADGDAQILSGWVGKQQDKDALEQFSSRIAGQVRLVSQVALRPWPQCEAMLTLSDVVQDHGLKLAALDHDGADYDAGSRLVLRVTMPDFAGYLYVTYIEASGDAVPLYKPRGVVPQALAAGAVVTLGGGDDPRVFRIGPPFGQEMVVAVAAKSPLFTDAMAANVTEREYLSALRKTLEYKPDPDQPDRLVDGDVVALTTHAAPSAGPK
jgi:hypothetical protein